MGSAPRWGPPQFWHLREARLSAVGAGERCAMRQRGLAAPLDSRKSAIAASSCDIESHPREPPTTARMPPNSSSAGSEESRSSGSGPSAMAAPRLSGLAWRSHHRLAVSLGAAVPRASSNRCASLRLLPALPKARPSAAPRQHLHQPGRPALSAPVEMDAPEATRKRERDESSGSSGEPSRGLSAARTVTHAAACASLALQAPC